MPHLRNATPEQLASYKAIVLAYLMEHGPLPRSDIWQGLHGQLSVNYVDRSLKGLLEEGRIQATKLQLTKSVAGPWKTGKVVTYTASVYRAV